MVVSTEAVAEATTKPKPGSALEDQDGGKGRVTLTIQELQQARREAAASVGKPGPRWEYDVRSNCVNGAADAICGAATACDNGQIQSIVLRRWVNPDGTPVPNDPRSQWSSWGLTCFPQLLPGNNLPTVAQIQQAFREINFTKATVKVQPVGNVTLVNLPTYFEATWPEAGIGPGEVDSSTLLGFRVEIRAKGNRLQYVYGDGDASEPTTSLGGPYPDGDIQHTYDRKGTMATRVDTVYGGEFRIEGGQWMTIPGTVTVEGTPVTLEVREAKARLYGNANPAPRR